MKICNNCKIEKSKDNFSKHKDLLRGQCKSCIAKWAKLYRKSTSYKEKKARNKLELRNYINGIKENTPCLDCGKIHPTYVMDFDHLRDKKFNISDVMSGGFALETVKKEVAKCELVCANCHRIRTQDRHIKRKFIKDLT